MIRCVCRLAVGIVVVCITMHMPVSVFAQEGKAMVLAQIENHATQYGEIAQEIWDLAELGYLEEQSSALLQSTLAQAGFALDVGVADMPTAFVASFGNGGPVVAILAEFDALPGITQDRVPVRQQLADPESGHACGHHLFGTGSTAAAIAVKQWLQATNTPGTIRLYGTPAEEGGSGKVYMVRAGLFDDVDAVLHWHPGDRNGAGVYSTLAIKSVKFRFHGVSAHAAAAPHLARSALDGVEAMNVMVNMMREHVPQETRIHYVITGGGAAPNVTPDFAEVYYYLRHPDSEEVQQIFERVVKAAEGAALGTGTTVEREFAETLRASVPQSSPPLEAAARVDPFVVMPGAIPASTDVGDVSWVVPTVGLSAATWVPGTSAHTWQAIAAGGMSIGNKGMLVAAKAIALTAVDLFTNKELIASARDEYQRRVGPDFEYVPLLGDRAPPLDYRKRPGS